MQSQLRHACCISLLFVGFFGVFSSAQAAQNQGNNGDRNAIKEMCELDGGTFYDEGSKWVCYYPSGDVIVCVPGGSCTLLSSVPPAPHNPIQDYLRARVNLSSTLSVQDSRRIFPSVIARGSRIAFSLDQRLRFYGNVAISQHDLCGAIHVSHP